MSDSNKPAQKNPPRIVILGIVIGTIVVTWMVLRSGSSSTAKPPADPSYGARGACMLFVKQRLRDPGSAEWGDMSAWSVESKGQDQWGVMATYRAKNGFGGMNVEKSYCIVKNEGKEWSLVSLSKF